MERRHAESALQEDTLVMMTRSLAVLAIGAAALLSAPADAEARAKKHKRDDRVATRDCTPYNGPHGYYGNPWCDGGYKFAEDYPPGASPYFDVFDLPQIRRLGRRWK